MREVESHIRERVADSDALPDERAALERVLAGLGTPTRVARAYSLELSVEEALTTGRLLTTLRVLWLTATRTVAGFFGAMLLFSGYFVGAAFIITAGLYLFFPDNVGVITSNGVPQALGFRWELGPGQEMHGGWWVIPLCLIPGFLLLVLTHKGARAWIRWIRSRISSVKEPS